MSSTITRSTLADDTGTTSVPNEDGSVLNNDFLQDDIYDPIDDLFTGQLVVGRLAIESHSGGLAFSADVANSGGGIVASVRNTQAGTAANAEYRLGNDGSATATRIIMCSSTFTPGGFVLQDGLTILCERAGGLNLAASHASGLVRQMGKSGYDVGRPAQITSNQSDYTFGSDDSGVYILTSDASRSISGLAGGVDGRRIRIINGNAIGSGFIITLGVGVGSAGNQITNASNAGVAMNPKSMVDLVYDGTNTIWVAGGAS